jgi:hypothetical protein
MFAQDKVRFVKIQITIECHIACQHLEFSRKDYKLRCTLAIVSSWGSAAIQGS